MPHLTSNLEDAVSRRVQSAIKELLENKHLFQSIQIDEKEFDAVMKEAIEFHKIEVARVQPNVKLDGTPYLNNVIENLKKDRDQLLYSNWYFFLESSPPRGAKPVDFKDLPSLQLPSVRVSCVSRQCKGTLQPHNSGFIGLRSHFELQSFDLIRPGQPFQIFSLPYQCQNCKEEPLVFLVKRDNLKLTLVGRSKFPEVSVPSYIPEAQSKFYKNAIIANQTNFVLAAALYLRTVVEQYFYSVIPDEQKKAIAGNPTGDELADLYAKTLPENFPSNFPSLKKAYSDLSVILHSGKENDEVKKDFLAICNAVDGHFKAAQLFKEISKLK